MTTQPKHTPTPCQIKGAWLLLKPIVVKAKTPDTEGLKNQCVEIVDRACNSHAALAKGE